MRLSNGVRAVVLPALLGVVAFSLAACGRNGAPELPAGPVFSSGPSPAVAAAAPPPAGAMPVPPGSNEDIRERQYEKAAQNGFDRNGNPVAPPSERKSFFLDFLLQ